MDDSRAVSDDLSVSDLKSELELVRGKLQIAEQKIMQLELSLLQSRDFSIGAVAQTGEACVERDKFKDQLDKFKDQLKDSNIHIKNHLTHIKRLEEALDELDRASALNRVRSAELDRVYNSASWKIGRFMMIPVRVLRKIIN